MLFLTLGLLMPGAAAVNVVATMPNIWNVAEEIGGDSITVIYAAPPAAVHMASDTIDALLQQNSEFIESADIFLGQGGGMDETTITKVTDFRKKNFDLDTEWLLLTDVTEKEVPNISFAYDNPTVLEGYSAGIAYLLSQADPKNKNLYQKNLKTYIAKIEKETKLTNKEKELLSGVPIIAQFRIQNQAVSWLGMDPVDTYPQPTAVIDLIDDIHADPDKYKEIASTSPSGKIFVIENIVAGSDMGIGIHEALTDEGVPTERLIFLNLPKTAPGVDTILDYYAYNKNLILAELIPAAETVNVVATMPNIWNVAEEIGGDSITVIYAAPPAAVHMASDTIDALLQQNSEFIESATIFLGQGGGMDETTITKVTDFRKKNFDLDTEWLLLTDVTEEEVPNISFAYDNPTVLEGYSAGIAYLLSEANPTNKNLYQKNLETYIAKIEKETKLSAKEKKLLSGVPIIAQFRIQNQAVNWLGMDPVDTYPQPTAVIDLIDDIHADPDKYKEIASTSPHGKIFVIENIVAGADMGVGIHEALEDEGVPTERLIFLNLPKAAPGVDTILEYYAYNKNLILEELNR